jgi:hypothetical protein
VGYWNAFLDESGSFENPSERTVLAAVLGRNPVSSPSLRKALQRALPGVPYPPHASRLNVPMFRVACALANPKSVRQVAPPFREVLDDVAKYISSSKDPVAVEFLLAVEKANHPREGLHRLPYGILRQADTWLGMTRPAMSRALRAMHMRGTKAMLELLENLPDHYQVVASWEAGDPEASPEPETAEERYFRVLDGLLERIQGLLGGGTVRPVVLIVPSRHHIVNPARVRAFSGLRSGAPGSVTFLVGIPKPYDDRMNPAFVLADFVSNRLRNILQPTRPWDLVARQWASKKLLEAPPRFDTSAETLPTIAAEGTPRALVRTALDGAVDDALVNLLGTGLHGWPKDQAERWIRAL